MGVSEKLFSFVPQIEAPVNRIYSWIVDDMEQTNRMLEAESALAILREIGEYAHRYPKRFYSQLALLTLSTLAAACTALEIDTGTAPVETQIPIPTAQPEPSPTPVAPDATTTTGVETTPTTSPEGERLLGSNIPIMGGGLQLGTELIVGSIQKLPGDIPPEIIQNYGFVADAERQTGITVQAGLGGPSYFVSGSLEAVQELPLNQRESSPGIYVYGEEQSKIVVIGIREIIEGSQYFMGIGPDGQPVMIERTADGNYNILNDRDLQLPGEQDWVVGKLPDAQITMDLSTGYVTIGDQVHSINAEAPATPALIPFEQMTDVSQAQKLTYEQLMTIESNMDFSDLENAPLEGSTNGGLTVDSNGILHIWLGAGLADNKWVDRESIVNIDDKDTYILKMRGPKNEEVTINAANPYLPSELNIYDAMQNPSEIQLYLDPSILLGDDKTYYANQIAERYGLPDILWELIAASNSHDTESFWNILMKLNDKLVPISVVYKMK